MKTVIALTLIALCSAAQAQQQYLIMGNKLMSPTDGAVAERYGHNIEARDGSSYVSDGAGGWLSTHGGGTNFTRIDDNKWVGDDGTLIRREGNNVFVYD